MRLLRDAILLSLSITAVLALVAWGLHELLGTRYLLIFVYLRWAAVALLLAMPIVAKAKPALGLPRLLQTPLTALVLVCESVLIDIISAQTH